MTKKCSLCGSPTSWERESEEQPPEGEVCDVCSGWVCPDCVDWAHMSKTGSVEAICKPCAKVRGSVQTAIKEVK